MNENSELRLTREDKYCVAKLARDQAGAGRQYFCLLVIHYYSL